MQHSENAFDHVRDSFTIWQRKAASSMMLINHYHDAYEIYYLLEGERYYFIKDRTYHVSKGDLVFIKMNDIHKAFDANNLPHERILINFKKDFIAQFAGAFQDIDLFTCFDNNFHVIRLNPREQHQVEDLLAKMLTEDKKKSLGYSSSIKLTLCELLLFMNRYLLQNPSNVFDYPNPMHKKISEIVVYINGHYVERISLEQLSSRFFISPYYLSRIFKEITGFTFVEYVNSIRIREAKKLLLESDWNVTAIAEKVGYESTTHFGRVFKEITGVSPLKFRKSKEK